MIFFQKYTPFQLMLMVLLFAHAPLFAADHVKSLSSPSCISQLQGVSSSSCSCVSLLTCGSAIDRGGKPIDEKARQELNAQLVRAVLIPSLNGVQRAINAGADPKQSYIYNFSCSGMPVLNYVARQGNLPMVKLLIAAKADVHDYDKNVPLCMKQLVKAIQILFWN
jgi:hypothetical protein